LNGQVEKISLDHDLGERADVGDGYEVMRFIETQVHTNKLFVCPEIVFHTDNPVGRKNMTLALQAVEKMLRSRR